MGKSKTSNVFYRNLLDSRNANHSATHFNFVKVEDLPVHQEKPLIFSRRSYFKVSLVSGRSKIHYADQSIDVCDHALVFTNPMIPYSWERLGNVQTGYIVIFDERFIGNGDRLQDYPVFRSAANAVIELSEIQFKCYDLLFKRIAEEFDSDYKYRLSLLRGLVLELIHNAQKMQPETNDTILGSTAYERLTVSFLKLLENSFSQETYYQPPGQLTPRFFAEKLHVHINYLNKVLKEITGQTTSSLISSRLAQEATILLRNSDHSISEIAWALGFNDPNHFSGFIKKHTGLSPTGYRGKND